MSDTFQVKIDGGDELKRLIVEVQSKVGSVDRVMPAIAEILLGAVFDVVDAEGPGWPELSKATLMKRRKNGRGAKMLRDTGAMMQSLSPGWGSDFAEVFFGTDYAKYHTNDQSKRNPFALGPFEAGMMEDITELLLGSLV